MSSSTAAASKVGLGITVQGWGRDNKGDTGKLLTQIDVVIRSKQECNDKGLYFNIDIIF